MNRHQLREETFCLLFLTEFHPEDEIGEQMRIFIQERDMGDQGEYVEKKVADIIAHHDEIDSRIEDRSENWKLSRMGRVEQSLLRLAVYEVLYEQLPRGIAINEAVELAKVYGEENSPSFVNGVLARVIGQDE
ncbi:MAG: transcription antitermination factor NusB [Lachnospiraceae bacterium]|nr:transcription antitermination factor NusB [Lachnospiraceae bacterium]